MYHLQTCEDCGAVHRYYTKPFKDCRRITEVIDGRVIRCKGNLIEKEKKKQRRCGKCGGLGHNARTCKP